MSKLGSDLGNFIYIDTNKPQYLNLIQESLAESLSMASMNTSVKLKLNSKNKTMEFRLKEEAIQEEEVKKEESMQGIEEPNKLATFKIEEVLPSTIVENP